MLLCSNELFLAYARPGLIPIVTEDPQRAEGHHRRHQCGREAERIKSARHACDALIVSAHRRGPRHWRARRRPRLWRGHFLLHLHLLPVGRAPFLVVAGGWMAATATVALAEEVAELVRGERRMIRQNALRARAS